MDKNDVETSITKHYISSDKSKPLKLMLNSGSVYKGKFIRDNQKEMNARRNKWVITIDFVELMLDGADIKFFFPPKHK